MINHETYVILKYINDSAFRMYGKMEDKSVKICVFIFILVKTIYQRTET